MTSGEEDSHFLDDNIISIKEHLLAKAREDVKFLMDYEVLDSCDEKLLKLMANRCTLSLFKKNARSTLILAADTERGLIDFASATPRKEEASRTPGVGTELIEIEDKVKTDESGVLAVD